MIPNGEEWHFIALKKLRAILRRITSKRHGDLNYLNCLHSFRTET